MLKKVLIAGRPNVGKSSLFNRLVKHKKALILNRPGVTRDILKHKASWWGKNFEVWDSGGLWGRAGLKNQAALAPLIDHKVKQALQAADMVLLVMDGREGLTDEDKKTFRLIKKSGKPFLTLINKIDNWNKKHHLLSDFARLGTRLAPCAFETDKGITDIVEWIASRIPSLKNSEATNLKSAEKQTPVLSPPTLLTAGKPNVGKSLLFNTLLRKDRSLASPVKGTTVDVVEDTLTRQKNKYVLLDTAGFFNTKGKDLTAKLAQMKMQNSLKKSDLLLLLVESVSGPSRQDARLLELCLKEHKPALAVVSKWDLMPHQSKKEYRTHLKEKFSFYPDLPVVFISSLKKQGLNGLLKKADDICRKMHTRIATSELNRFLTSATRKAPAPVYGVQDLKLYYWTQIRQNPPAFLGFANYPQAVTTAYRRFLIRQIQKQWKLQGIPLRLVIEKRPRGQKPQN